MLEFITGLLWNPDFPFLTFFTPAFALAYWWVGGLWERQERKDVVVWLKYNRSRHLYRHLITRALDSFSGFLGNREVRIRRGRGWDETEILDRNRLPWSWGLLDFVLLMAIAYPLLSLIGQWALFGQGKIGSLTILTQMDLDDRRFPLLLLICSLISYLWAVTSKTRWLRALIIPAMGLFVWFMVELFTAKYSGFLGFQAVFRDVLKGTGAFAFVATLGATFAVALATAFAVAATFAGAFAATFAFAFAVVAAATLATAFATAFAVSAAFPATLVVATAFVVAATLSTAFAVVAAVSAEWARSRLEREIARPSLALLGWLSFLFMGFLIAQIWSLTNKWISEIAMMLLFLGFLPLLNALADFASTGLTRHFLARGAAGNPGLFGLIDIVAGAATFFGLGFAMIGTIALVKALGGPDLIDLGSLLGPRGTPDAILTDPHDYWWLYLTFLSTLLPTVIHSFIATFVFGVMWPERLRMWLATSLASGSYVAGRPACLALAALIALSVALPLTLLYYLGWALAVYYPQAGEMLIQIFRSFAVLTGAI